MTKTIAHKIVEQLRGGITENKQSFSEEAAELKRHIVGELDAVVRLESQKKYDRIADKLERVQRLLDDEIRWYQQQGGTYEQLEKAHQETVLNGEPLSEYSLSKNREGNLFSDPSQLSLSTLKQYDNWELYNHRFGKYLTVKRKWDELKIKAEKRQSYDSLTVEKGYGTNLEVIADLGSDEPADVQKAIEIMEEEVKDEEQKTDEEYVKKGMEVVKKAIDQVTEEMARSMTYDEFSKTNKGRSPDTKYHRTVKGGDHKAYFYGFFNQSRQNAEECAVEVTLSYAEPSRGRNRNVTEEKERKITIDLPKEKVKSQPNTLAKSSAKKILQMVDSIYRDSRRFGR